MKFRDKDVLMHWLLDQIMEPDMTFRQKVAACHLAVWGAEKLWREHGVEA